MLGTIGSRTYRLLIDTGATHTLLHPKVLSEEEASQLVPSLANIRSVTGELTPVTGLATVKIQLGGLTLNHTAFVAPIDQDCILGVDFLKKHRCMVDFSRWELRLGRQRIGLRNPRSTQTSSNPAEALATSAVLSSRPEKCEEKDPVDALYQRDLVALDSTQRSKLWSVLEKHRQVFATSSADLGRTAMVLHDIEVGAARPIKQPPRRIPFARRSEADKLIDEMAQNNIIRPSNSPWCSPVVLVRKKDGNTRFCVDYRRLNEVTTKDSYPLPRMDLILESLANSRWFATLDLQSGYWQVELAEKAKEKTAFSIGHGLWEFTVMPFGLCNAPATFQRLMEKVLGGLPFDVCLVYLDDVLVHAPTFESLMDRLENVLGRLEAAGLKLSANKCTLCQKKVKYLGHLITEEGIGTDPEKIAAVRDWPIPRNRREVQSFMGLCAYYRRFIRNFSDIAGPLHQLSEKNRRFDWSTDCQRAFEHLKALLTQAPVLMQPRWDSPFILDTDASLHALGAVLSQKADQGERVIEYYSKTFSRAERNYCVTRRELLALVRAVKHFQPYLIGRRFQLRTDHASLRWLTSFKEPEGQVARWIQRLQEFDFELIHRPGKQHANADALSRRPCEAENCRYCGRLEERETLAVRVTTIVDDMVEGQREDPILREVREWLTNQRRPAREEIVSGSPELKAYWNMFSSLFLCNGKVCRHISQTPDEHHQLLVPRNRVREIIQQAHESPVGGHFGKQRTLAKVKQQFYWIDCTRDVERHCATCITCQARHGPRTRQKSRLQTYNVGAPFERVAIDILGPLPKTARDHQYILVVMDYFTKWPEAIPLPNQTAETVAEACVQHVFSRFGCPLQLHSDQGRNFESAVFQSVMRIFAIDKTRTTPLHPQSDGMVERFNRTILDYLAKFVDRTQSNWDLFLPLLLMSYRSAVHETTKQTPAMLLFGRELRLPAGLLHGYPPSPPTTADTYPDLLVERLQQIHGHNRDMLSQATRRAKDRYDLRANTQNLELGTLVWLFSPKRRVGRCPKLQCDWEGPYRVLERINDVVYKIRRQGGRKTTTVHRDRLMPYVGREPLDDTANSFVS